MRTAETRLCLASKARGGRLHARGGSPSAGFNERPVLRHLGELTRAIQDPQKHTPSEQKHHKHARRVACPAHERPRRPRRAPVRLRDGTIGGRLPRPRPLPPRRPRSPPAPLTAPPRSCSSRSRARALAELEMMRAWARAALALFSIVYAFAIGGSCIGGGCSTCHERTYVHTRVRASAQRARPHSLN